MNVIITNIGRRGYLIEYIKNTPGFHGNVYASDCDKYASGLYSESCDKSFILPKPIDDENEYIIQLIDLCKKEKIGLVIPVIDPEIFILSNYREEFHKQGINVAVSSKKVLDICYDKKKMNIFLKKIGLDFPLTFSSIDEFNEERKKGTIDFPIIIKPILGSGSVETQVVDCQDKLASLFHKGMIIQELIVGEEYGIDVFNNMEGVPVRCVIKRKLSMRSGETDKSISVIDDDIKHIIMKLAEKLKHIGNLDCDVLVRDECIYIIDLNPRFGGGYPATHTIGVNLLEVLINMCSGKVIEPEFDNYQDGILVMKTISVEKVCVDKISEILAVNC